MPRADCPAVSLRHARGADNGLRAGISSDLGRLVRWTVGDRCRLAGRLDRRPNVVCIGGRCPFCKPGRPRCGLAQASIRRRIIVQIWRRKTASLSPLIVCRSKPTGILWSEQERWHGDGKHPDFRHIQFEAGARSRLGSLSVDEKQDAVRKIFRFVDDEPRLRAVAEHPAILAVVRRLLGAEPVLFEDKALIKPPRIGREKPWHQDHAYWNLPLDTPVVTVWIALDPATVANGCMLVIPGSNREGPVVHFNRRDWQICDTEVGVNRAVAAPLAPGGCLFFNSYLQHGTPANRSPQRRRALQFVYIPAGAARITQGERLAVFGSEGKDVTC
ncbi:MAG TPA: phytanoyl-CoA dioxygenase family protein [Chloroflexota bacterium]